MLERFAAKNFQCHGKIDVDTSGGVTAIVGPSDSGKSALIRILRWLATNRPKGIGFIKDGEKSAQARMKIDGHTIKRTRSKNRNVYELDKMKFGAFGLEVPEEIEALLNMGEENWQGQHDPPFWFTKSAPELARELNEIVDLQSIDVAVSRVSANLREVNDDIKVYESGVEEEEKASEKLDWVEKADEQLKAIESLADESAEDRTRLAFLEHLIEERGKYTSMVDVLSRKLVWASKICSRIEEFRHTQEEVEILEEMIDESIGHQESASLELPDLEPMGAALSALRVASDEAGRLATVVQSANNWNKRTMTCERDLELAEEEFVKKVGNNCPYCGTEMNDGG